MSECNDILVHNNNLVRFVLRATTINLFKVEREYKSKKRQHALIVLKNMDTGFEEVHFFTSFIFLHWKNNDYNTQRAKARHIIVFLNYIIDNKKSLEIRTIEDIQFDHGTRFLNYLTEKGNDGLGDRESTVRKYECTLRKFFKYLANRSMLRHIPKGDIRLDAEESPFVDVHYNKKRTRKIIHDIKKTLILEFIETAYHKVPIIALGVYYQVFGGLRVGDAVNVSRSNITNIDPFGKHGQILRITEQFFREDLSNSSGSNGAKRERDQVVFPYKNMLSFLYKNHLRNFTPKNTDALFVNKRGDAMTGDSYRYYFNKLKRCFIDRLINKEDIMLSTYAVYLNTVEWSTHIGRGIFSNIMAEFVNNALQLASARGDSSLDASLNYIENTERMMKKMELELEKMWTGNFFME